jgi:hypothetical protein
VTVGDTTCPDGAVCARGCPGVCWRVVNAGEVHVSPVELGELSRRLHSGETELLRPTLRVDEDGETDLDFEVGTSHVSVYATLKATTVRIGAVTLVVSHDRALLVAAAATPEGSYGHLVLYEGSFAPQPDIP